MPKVDLSKYERKHNESIDAYVRRVERIYRKAAKKAAEIAAGISRVRPDRIFAFSDQSKAIRDKIDEVFRDMQRAILATVITASREEWFLANLKNDELVKAVLDNPKLKREVIQRYFSNNDKALDAFQTRKVNGLGLSDRVWKLTDAYKNEIELALDAGIGTGKSAAAMARDVQKYLKEPDKLFRRVRDKHGELKLSKAAKSYKPGQGIYRSSYKNAERVTRTETNIAYRSADHLRNMQLDFVVGFEVRRSNNPYICPICGPLAGKYPKTFKFVGWHPNCRCYVIAILMTDEEIDKLQDALLAGEEISIKSENQIVSPHGGFSDYIRDNKEMLLRRKSQPYFVTDNNIRLG